MNFSTFSLRISPWTFTAELCTLMGYIAIYTSSLGQPTGSSLFLNVKDTASDSNYCTVSIPVLSVANKQSLHPLEVYQNIVRTFLGAEDVITSEFLDKAIGSYEPAAVPKECAGRRLAEHGRRICVVRTTQSNEVGMGSNALSSCLRKQMTDDESEVLKSCTVNDDRSAKKEHHIGRQVECRKTPPLRASNSGISRQIANDYDDYANSRASFVGSRKASISDGEIFDNCDTCDDLLQYHNTGPWKDSDMTCCTRQREVAVSYCPYNNQRLHCDSEEDASRCKCGKSSGLYISSVSVAKHR